MVIQQYQLYLEEHLNIKRCVLSNKIYYKFYIAKNEYRDIFVLWNPWWMYMYVFKIYINAYMSGKYKIKIYK